MEDNENDNKVLMFNDSPAGSSPTGISSLPEEVSNTDLIKMLKKLNMVDGFNEAPADKVEEYVHDHDGEFEQKIVMIDGRDYIMAQMRPDSPIHGKLQVPAANGKYYMSFMGLVGGDAKPGKPDSTSFYPSSKDKVNYWKVFIRPAGQKKCGYNECEKEHGFLDVVFDSAEVGHKNATLISDELYEFAEIVLSELAKKN